MKKIIFLIPFIICSFGFSQNQPVYHEIHNLTSNYCSSYEFFGSFNDSGDCGPLYNTKCFDIPYGLTSHISKNQDCDKILDINLVTGMTLWEFNSQVPYYISFCDDKGNVLSNGSQYIQLTNCPNSAPLYILVEWSIVGSDITIVIT